METDKLNARELGTVLAALRFWQVRGHKFCPEHDVATDGGRLEALTNNEIDELCERLNGGGEGGKQTYSLAEVRNGTGWPAGAQFSLVGKG